MSGGNAKQKLVTILVPALNEAGNIPELHARLSKLIAEESGRYAFEILFLDNASTDSTREQVLALCAKNSCWRYVRYSRTFDYHASLAAGFDLARGDAVVFVAGDLQEPVEMIPRMLRGWEAGNDVVYGVLRQRNDHSWLKTFGARIGYWLIAHLADYRIPPNATDFRLLDRRVVEVVRSLREADRYLRGLVHWVGFRQSSFEYDRGPRTKGRSNWGFFASVLMTLHAIVCFSTKPLRLLAAFGLLTSLGSIALAFVYLALRYFGQSLFPIPAPGITLLALLLIFTVGLNSLFLGIIGEYVGRIYYQGKQRPLYIIDEMIGGDSNATGRQDSS